MLDFALWMLVFSFAIVPFFLADIMSLVPAGTKSKEAEENTMSILSTTHLTKQYGQEPNIVRALDDVSISIEQGEFVAIIGTSGSGACVKIRLS